MSFITRVLNSLPVFIFSGPALVAVHIVGMSVVARCLQDESVFIVHTRVYNYYNFSHFVIFFHIEHKNSEQKNVESYSSSRFHLRPTVHVERDLDPNQVNSQKAVIYYHTALAFLADALLALLLPPNIQASTALK